MQGALPVSVFVSHLKVHLHTHTHTEQEQLQLFEWLFCLDGYVIAGSLLQQHNSAVCCTAGLTVGPKNVPLLTEPKDNHA